jgi:hypothetical protein
LTSSLEGPRELAEREPDVDAPDVYELDEWAHWEAGQVPLEGCKWSVGGRVTGTGALGMLGWRDGKLVGTPEALRAVDQQIARRAGKPLCHVVLSRDDEAGAIMAAMAVMSGCYVGQAPELPEYDNDEPYRKPTPTSQPPQPVAAPVMPPLRPLNHGRESRGRRRVSGAASSDDDPEPEPPLARRRRASRRGGVA